MSLNLASKAPLRAMFLLVAFACGTGAARAGYIATLLHPVGFEYTHGQGNSGGYQSGYGRGPATNGHEHALLWNGTASSVTDIHPAGFTDSQAYRMSGNSVVGVGFSVTQAGSTPGQALLWNNLGANVVNLTPAGFLGGAARDVSGTSQVGAAYRVTETQSTETHAFLWHGTAESAIDLNPAGFRHSTATAVSGNVQVGHGHRLGNPNSPVPLMWNGTAESAVDLLPAGMLRGEVFGVSQDSQVGWTVANAPDNPHATLWHGTPESAVDLHPAHLGFLGSEIYDVEGTTQVGAGLFAFGPRAVAWNGTANSAIDLHQYLTGLGVSFATSQAIGIDENGDIVGTANDGVTNTTNYAVKWTFVPEPNAILLSAFAWTAAVSSQRRGNRTKSRHFRAV
jgi:hypothetical protein